MAALAYDRALRLALDKSVRRFDSDGHLHIETSPISKANVCPYYGCEIPEFESLGLDPERVYHLWRHPEELKRAAPSFEGKPLMLVHRGVTADDHAPALVVGSLSAPVRFDGTYLHAPLHVWDQDAIDGIEDNTKRQLSAGYRYRADMTPGRTPDGVPYDGVMRDIEGNHVALVEEGRAGPDVFVGDSAPSPFRFTVKGVSGMAKANPSRTALLATGALSAYVLPRLAADAQIDIAKLVGNVTGRTWPAEKPKIVAAVRRALDGKMKDGATDSGLEETADLIDAPAKDEASAEEDIEAKKRREAEEAARAAAAKDADGPGARLMELLRERLTPEELAEAEALLNPEPAAAGGVDNQAPAGTAVSGGTPVRPRTSQDRRGMDQAMVDRMVREAEARTIERMEAIAEAREAVRPFAGDIAFRPKDAHEIYKFALDAMGVDTADLQPNGYRALFNAAAKARQQAEEAAATAARQRAPMAVDSAHIEDLRTRIPGLNVRQV